MAKTLGQVAFEAWCHRRYHGKSDGELHWGYAPYADKQAWEAAAEAVDEALATAIIEKHGD